VDNAEKRTGNARESLGAVSADASATNRDPAPKTASAVGTSSLVSLKSLAPRYDEAQHGSYLGRLESAGIEHRLNWLLMDAARRRGLTLRQAAQVVRDANMPQKTGTTWLLLLGSPFAAKTEKDIGKVATARNNFVHYKWPEGHLNDSVPKVADMAEAISAAERAVRGLDDLFMAHVYGGDDQHQATDRPVKTAHVFGLALLLALALTACTSANSTTGTPTTVATTAATAAAATGAQVTTPATSARPGLCVSSGLRASLGQSRGTAGTSYVALLLVVSRLV
jgi:hypothetical protein